MCNLLYILHNCVTHTKISICNVLQSLVALIHEVACCHISSASLAIQASIVETQDELTLMLDKTSIPRPAALGGSLQSYWS